MNAGCYTYVPEVRLYSADSRKIFTYCSLKSKTDGSNRTTLKQQMHSTSKTKST